MFILTCNLLSLAKQLMAVNSAIVLQKNNFFMTCVWFLVCFLLIRFKEGKGTKMLRFLLSFKILWIISTVLCLPQKSENKVEMSNSRAP